MYKYFQVKFVKVQDKEDVEAPPFLKEGSPAPSLQKTVVKRKSTPARFITPLQGVIVQENDRIAFEAVIDGITSIIFWVDSFLSFIEFLF